ncbi:MAG: efflux RND transporter permease subunit [Pseudomonadota bacterium]
MNLAAFALNKRLISAVSTFLILASGYFAYNLLPRFEDPEFIIRQAQIITPYPGASAEEVADEVTEVIENALQELEGVDEVRSVSSPGLSNVTVEFTIAATPDHPELDQKFTQMRAKILDTQSSLPPNALETQVFDDYGDVFALYYAIVGEDYTISELYEYAKDLQRELVTVEGVSKVVLNGVQNEVIYVEYSPARLIELGLSAGQIGDLLEGQSLVTPAGSILAGNTRLTLRPESAVDSLDAIGNLVITASTGATFKLSDIAEVSRGLEEPATELLYRDGQQAVGIGVANTLGGNVVNMGNAVRAKFQELDSLRPIGIEVLTISDQGISVKASVDSFVVNVGLALAIVVGTLLVFMGLRSGILMGGILLVTVAGTLMGMLLYGLDMQRISLGALIIALGMLVDNAIVVVEGTLVRTQKGETAAEASVAVVKQTIWPLLGGTLVGILAFSPIGFSPDNTGEYAGSLFWTIGIALLFSWLVAVWLTPYFCTLLFKPGNADEVEDKEGSFLGAYRRFLMFAIKTRYATVILVVALFASSIMMFSQVPPGFFPTSTRPQFVIDYTLPEGTDITRTEADVLEIAEYARGLEGVTGTNTMVGAGHQRFMLTYESSDPISAYGQVLVDVEEYAQIDGLQKELQAYLDETYSDALIKVWTFVLGPGGGAKVEARFFGPDAGVLRTLSEQAKNIMVAAGAVAVADDWREQIQVIRPVINIDNARRLNLTQGEITNALYSHLEGTNLGKYREGDELRDVIMRPVDEARNDASTLNDIQVFSQVTGAYVPITQVVDRFDLVFEASNLRRINRELAITAQSDNAPGVLAGDLYEAVKGPIEEIELPPGYRLTWEGEAGSSAEANEGLAQTFPYGIGAMFIVVLFLFNAWRQTIIIWLAVPLIFIGVIYGLALSGTPLEFMAILGILSLTGMLIKNAIVLIDETDGQIASGKARMTAVVDSAVSRVRPVCLGVLTTVLGVIPLLWDPFFKSLAVVIICGLSFATILTLIIVPTLYTIFFKVKGDET